MKHAVLIVSVFLSVLLTAHAAPIVFIVRHALVVGHGNTIPELIKALGVATPIAIPENDYSEIFVVLAHDPPQLFQMHYPF